jgi:SRSO17 transposase
MSLLEHPKALALLAEAEVTADAVRGCKERLTRFLQRYLPWFYREEQRELAEVVIAGKLSNLQRKTSEPIAYAAERERKPVQHFVGAGKWDDEAVTAELRRDVAEEIGDPDGVLVVDGSGFPKKGTESCGVARQWCGRLGKLDNCQVGVFVAYASVKGHAPLDRRLFLPEAWANDAKRRRKCHVPKEVVFQEKWRIALDLLPRCLTVPHGWVTADDEFGRVSEFRGWLRRHRQQYVVDGPCNTLVRELVHRPDGRKPAFERADAWAARQPASRWKTITVRDGAKGPLKVRAIKARVQTKDDEGCAGPAETLIVTRTLDQDKRTTYHLSNAPSTARLWKLVSVGSRRHEIEEVLQEAKGEVGMGHYEARSWVGWHHHMTLSLLALWFLARERRRVGEKNPNDDGAANLRGVPLLASANDPQLRPNRQCRQSGSSPHHRGPHLSLLRRYQELPAPTRRGVFVKGLQ